MVRDLANDRKARRRLEAAVRRMPAPRRAIFLAMVIEDTGYAEVGRRLGLDPIAVEQEFARALVELAAANDPRPSWWRRAARRVAARLFR